MFRGRSKEGTAGFADLVKALTSARCTPLTRISSCRPLRPKGQYDPPHPTHPLISTCKVNAIFAILFASNFACERQSNQTKKLCMLADGPLCLGADSSVNFAFFSFTSLCFLCMNQILWLLFLSVHSLVSKSLRNVL